MNRGGSVQGNRLAHQPYRGLSARRTWIGDAKRHLGHEITGYREDRGRRLIAGSTTCAPANGGSLSDRLPQFLWRNVRRSGFDQRGEQDEKMAVDA